MAPRQRKGKKKGSDQKEKQAADAASGKKPSKATQSSRDDKSDRTTALTISFVAFLTYISNGGYMMGGDSVANMYLPLQILRGKLWWTPFENPYLFTWKMRTREGTFEDIHAPNTMDGLVSFANQTSTNMTAQEMLDQKQFYFVKQKYMLVPVARDVVENKLRGSERYVNTFNIGTGITFLPIVVVLAIIYGFDLSALQRNSWLLFHVSKATAALLVAASGGFVYLAALTFPSVSRRQATAVASVYCFCTCTWSVSSQSLWQHGANEFYLSLAVFALTTAVRRHTDGRGWQAKMIFFAGFSAGMATLSRPTSAVVALSIGMYLLFLKRSVRMSIAYAAGGSLLATVQLYYNWFCFEDPFQFGQQQASREIAVHRTGSSDLWQTPLLLGAATLLFSPSRGLFVFSPVTLLAMPGLFLVWRPQLRGRDQPRTWFDSGKANESGGNEFEVLRPLAVSILVLWTAAFKFFDYWGGWCYGYRPLVDTMPMLVLFLCVVVNKFGDDARMKYLVCSLVAWSVAVQFIGATACTNHMWNTRNAYRVTTTNWEGEDTELVLDAARVREIRKEDPGATVELVGLNIDRPEHRHRLWSWSDSQILFYIQNYEKAKQVKPLQMEAFRKFG